MSAQRDESQEEETEVEADEEVDEAEMPEEDVKDEPPTESNSNPIEADPEPKDEVMDIPKEQIAQKGVMDEAENATNSDGSPDACLKAEADLDIKEGVTGEDQPGVSTLTDGVKGEAMAVDIVSI